MSDLPDNVMLSQVEVLELKNINLQKKILDMQLGQILAQESNLMNRVNERTKVDMKKYEVNIETGECTLRKPDGMVSS